MNSNPFGRDAKLRPPRRNMFGWDGHDDRFFRTYVVGQWGELTQQIRTIVLWCYANRRHAGAREHAREAVNACHRALRIIESSPPHWLGQESFPREDALQLKYERAARLVTAAETHRLRQTIAILWPLAANRSRVLKGLKDGVNAQLGAENSERVIAAFKRERAAGRSPPDSEISELLGLSTKTVGTHRRNAEKSGKL